MYETYSERVHTSVAIDARLSYEYYKSSFATTALESIRDNLLLVANPACKIELLNAEHNAMTIALGVLEALLATKSKPDEATLQIILDGINAMDEALSSGLIRTSSLYEAERLINQSRNSVQN